jgi:hypothetical protein
MILFAVRRQGVDDEVVLVTAKNDKFAASKASQFIFGNPLNYKIEPLTTEGTTIHLDITVKTRS